MRFDAFGDVLQPMNVSSLGAGPPSSSLSSTTTATPAVPIISTTPVPSSASSQSLLKGDLDASLASLAQNLDINGPKGAGFKNRGQFNQSPKSMMKTGGTPMVSSTSTPAISSTAGMWSMPGMAGGGGMPAWANQAAAVPAVAGNINWPATSAAAAGGNHAPMMPAMMMGTPVMPSVSPSMPLGFGMRPPSMIPGAVSVLPAGVTPATLSSALNSSRLSTGTNSTAPTTTSTFTSQVSDPFGAL
ncbi:hypothetical protein TYRP_010009 [Tyrophagus putrescentiae]|nr:hypothetical protein TYRP_010009 [Tyrophagus putrescentiae]